MTKKIFNLKSNYTPQGDQGDAINKLVTGIKNKEKSLMLLGVTGSGKTFTIANAIEKLNTPTLIISHNKTLAAQLYGEFSEFFPNNLVEYYVSYYDYYQPEAYLPVSNKYIAKDLSINADLEKLRLKAISALLSGRRDVIIISSVSCIYGVTNPDEFKKTILTFKKNQKISMREFSLALVDMLYGRNDLEFPSGSFRVKGDTIDINIPYMDFAYRIIFWGDEIDEILTINSENGKKISSEKEAIIFPTSLFVASKEQIEKVIGKVQVDLAKQCSLFISEEKYEEEKRLRERTNLDLEMMEELGYCSGIENYSMYVDNRSPGERPYCLIDYFPKDYLMIIDESHVTVPQIKGMFGGDRARKTNLIENGFRLTTAMDNRPLNFEEFETLINQVIFVSATPAEYEIEKCSGEIIEQIIRPTGLLDPIIEVRKTENQINNIILEIKNTIKKGGRILITTLTKKMAEELDDYLHKEFIKSKYIHSDIKTLERVNILQDLRTGEIDVLIGVNLLREGLDLPEVMLVAILDADKEGFLRNQKSLIQTIGRAARNTHGKVIMYADKITESMNLAISETKKRRSIQEKFNKDNNIIPVPLNKRVSDTFKSSTQYKNYDLREKENIKQASESNFSHMDKNQILKEIKSTEKKMKEAALSLNFSHAAKLRDDMLEMKNYLENIK